VGDPNIIFIFEKRVAAAAYVDLSAFIGRCRHSCSSSLLSQPNVSTPWSIKSLQSIEGVKREPAGATGDLQEAKNGKSVLQATRSLDEKELLKMRNYLSHRKVLFDKARVFDAKEKMLSFLCMEFSLVER